MDDWLPAGLEYLLCGQTDNTTDAATNPGSVDEYPGSPSIAGEVATPAHCLTPATVATVDTDPDGAGPLPTAVYTHVEWTGLGDLAPSASLTIEFVTAIPIRANTMTWTGSTPTAASLGQAANLDNNGGAETTNGEALTIFATATGTYTGTLGSGANPVEATGYDTVVARDIDTTKTVSDGTFAQEAWSPTRSRSTPRSTATRTPPQSPTPCRRASARWAVSTTTPRTRPSAPRPGRCPRRRTRSVVENADGTFTLVWDLGHMAPSTTDTITFPAADRTAYQADDAPTSPTVGNDSLTNTEIASGDLSVRCGSGNPNCTGDATNYISHDGSVTVDDVTESASATQTAAGPTITAYVSQNVAAGQPLDCATATYLTAASAGYPPTYQKGDDICFKVDVSYPPGNDFKNPMVTDFIPPNTTLVAAATTGASDASNVTFTQPAAGELQWTMGSELPTPDGNLYEAPGSLFETEFSVVATADPTVGNTFNLTQDLAKLVTSNTVGTTFTVRDLVTYQLAAPIVTLTKAVTTINGAGAPEFERRHRPRRGQRRLHGDRQGHRPGRRLQRGGVGCPPHPG